MAAASKLLANTVYAYKGMGLSMGTMITGWDKTVHARVFSVKKGFLKNGFLKKGSGVERLGRRSRGPTEPVSFGVVQHRAPASTMSTRRASASRATCLLSAPAPPTVRVILCYLCVGAICRTARLP